MKSQITSLLLALSIALCAPGVGVSQSLSDLGKLLGKGSNSTEKSTNTTDTTTTQSQQSSNPLGGLFEALGGGASNNSNDAASGTGDALGSIIGDIISSAITANQDLTVADLEGKWVYAAPACKFKSQDFLMSAGGEVAASQISEKLAPTYTRLGFTPEKYGVQFDDKGNYIMTFGQLPISGAATKSEEKGYFTFEFIKLGTYALATTPTYIEVLGNKMVILYEADKFVALFSSVVSKLGIKTLDTVVELVNSYDGVLIGFELNRQ